MYKIFEKYTKLSQFYFFKESSWSSNISFYELHYSHEELNYSLCGVLNFPLFDIRDKSDLKT